MPQITPYCLTFPGGLHLGTRGVNLEESATQLPADTLFAALLDTWRHGGYDPAQMAADFTRQPADPPFLLTSAFPFVGGVRFYPAPVDSARLFSTATLKQHGKAVKRIRYWSEALLRRALAGDRLDDWMFPADEHVEPMRGVALQGGALWMTKEEVESLPEEMRLADSRTGRPRALHALRQLRVYAIDRTPRVTIDRIRTSSSIFHTGRTTFADGCGLWFGVEWRSSQASTDATGSTWKVIVDRTLTQMQEDGLGGVRSSGYGAFHYMAGAPFHLPDPQPGHPVMLLSRYHPTGCELPGALAPPAAYVLVPVAGWLRSPDATAQRRKRLLMVSEGSVVCPPNLPSGDVVDVRPQYDSGPGVSHAVYRYGLALSVDASRLQEASRA